MKVKNFKYGILFFVAIMLVLVSVPVQASGAKRPENVKASAGNKTVKISWNASAGASHYRLYQYDKGTKRYIGIKNIHGTSITMKGLKCGQTYQFKVRAFFKQNGKMIKSRYSESVKVIPRPSIGIPKGVKSTVNGDEIKLSWKKVNGVSGYEVWKYEKSVGRYQRIATVTGTSFKVKKVKAGSTNEFKIRARKKADGKMFYSKYTSKVKVSVPKNNKKGKSTIKKFLQTALLPVGKTMYVWGGGWNEEDTGAGDPARTIGVSPRWETFFEQQDSGYDYNQTRFQINDGLDCSGYVGWSIYNIMNTVSGKQGYVMKAEEMTSDFASRGWGSYIDRYSVRDYKPGDIMSSACSDCGHVWIVIGECGDGSVVLVHASPAGVQINGTVNRYGSSQSEAVSLASYYMKRYFPKWYKKYPECLRGISYLTHYSQMRWDITGKKVMWDPEGLSNMSAQGILEELF